MVALGAHRSEETEEQGDILHTATQGRHLDGYGIETEEEVFAEAARSTASCRFTFVAARCAHRSSGLGLPRRG